MVRVNFSLPKLDSSENSSATISVAEVRLNSRAFQFESRL